MPPKVSAEQLVSERNLPSATQNERSTEQKDELTDELVQPEAPSPTSALRSASNVANIAIQDLCPGRPVHHVGLLADAVAFAIVIDALDHKGPADPSRLSASICAQALMPGVSPADVVAGNLTVYGDAVIAFSQHSGTPAEPPLASYASE